MQINRYFTKLYFLIAFCCLLATTVNAQREYFVYLQNDNQQPFYVNINKKNYSSSIIGYVILSKLKDSTYPIRIGFPGNNVPLDFDLKVNGGDQGFLLKNLGDQGWNLFNLQTLALQKSGVEKKKRDEIIAAERERQRLIDEKRRADSVALAVVLAEQQRVADSANAELAIIEKQRIQDSLALAMVQMEEQRRVDSVNAVIAEENRKTEASARLKELDLRKITGVEEAARKKEADLKYAAEAEKQKALALKRVEELEAAHKIEIEQKRIEDSIQSKQIEIDLLKAAEHSEALKQAEALRKKAKEKAPETVLREITETPVPLETLTGKIDEVKTDSSLVLVFVDGVDTINAVVPVTKNKKRRTGPMEQETALHETAVNAVLPVSEKKEKKAERKKALKSDDFSNAVTVNDPAVAGRNAPIEVVAALPLLADTSSLMEAVLPVKTVEVKKAKAGGIVSNNAFTKILLPGEASAKAKSPVRGSCNRVADEKDFNSLRKKMLASETDVDEMILVALQNFKEKCYSSAQIKSLSVLFLTDSNKYEFFIASYSYVHDRENFPALVNLLSDGFFISQFNDMLK